MTSMYIPVVKKLIYESGILVERSLPESGVLNVSVGDKVEPSMKIGSCKVSYEVAYLGLDFKPVKKYVNSPSIVSGSKVGSLRGKSFFAPFNGTLDKSANGYVYKSEERDYWLLPGVWGEVVDTSHDRSALIKTQVVNTHLPVCTQQTRSGEIVVFPNPSDSLTVQYFNNFLKSPIGKIVYVGNTLSIELINRAKELEVAAILAGSSSTEAYRFALENDMALGLFSGFGNIPTPGFIYDFLNNVNSRYVFLFGESNRLQVPVPEKNDFINLKEPRSVLAYVKKGLLVQIFDEANFAKIGVVDRVTKSGILVRLQESEEVIEVLPPNLLALE